MRARESAFSVADMLTALGTMTRLNIQSPLFACTVQTCGGHDQLRNSVVPVESMSFNFNVFISFTTGAQHMLGCVVLCCVVSAKLWGSYL